jgi:hypothetical protein
MDSAQVNLGGRRLTIERARLGLFLRLLRWSNKTREAIKHEDSGALAQSILGYVKEYVADIDANTVPGIDIVAACAQLQTLNQFTIAIPILKSIGSAPDKKNPWDYDERVIVLWIHMIASAYHWALNEIRNLWPDEAAQFVQEILIDDQLTREWEYSLSQVAYKYDKKGKGELVPLGRPAWMLAGAPRTTRIPKRLLPVGHIIDLSGVKKREESEIGVSAAGSETNESV